MDKRGPHYLTPLGQVVVRHDPYLEKITSIWMMHVGLVAPFGNGPEYWRRIALDILKLEVPVSIEQIEQEVASRESVVFDKVRLGVSKFLDGYSNVDLLGDLGVVIRNETTVVAKAALHPPSPGVLGCFLSSSWDALHIGQLASNYEWFVTQSRLPEVFRISRLEVEAILDQVARMGLIEVFRAAPPYSIVRRWTEPAQVLERLYDDA